MSISALCGFAIDMDGTLIAGREVLPGAREFMAALRQAGIPLVVLSNSSRMLADELAGFLTELGITLEPTESLTALDILGPTIYEQMGHARLLAVGGASMTRGLEAAGHTRLPTDNWQAAEAVAVGNDPNFDYDCLRAASRAAARSGKLFSCNLDPRMPVENGEFDPGCGALAEAIAVASGVRPVVVGKPHLPLFQLTLQRLACDAAQVAMVGDRHASDIAGGHAAGMYTIWIHPGHQRHEPTPADLVVESLVELQGIWEAARDGG